MKMTPKSLHETAMDYAFKSAMSGDDSVSRKMYLSRALALEVCAALLLLDRLDCEPTRAILFRSASTLAMRAGEWACAKELADLGLSGNPPSDEAEYMCDLVCDAESCNGEPYGYKA